MSTTTFSPTALPTPLRRSRDDRTRDSDLRNFASTTVERGGGAAGGGGRGGKRAGEGEGMDGMDTYPIRDKVYEGEVSGVKDFGAFVSIFGVMGSAEGLVHITQMDRPAGRPSATELVNPGQRVFVKVLEVNGDRIGLSMSQVRDCLR